ncbi:MAG: amidohydrolase family protein [Deltaproteobacteria bacterium]|nr:amidohydrolase family protein [Deltaproteobacteria bacterium]
MKNGMVVDADSHVEEPEEAWAYLDKKYEARRPFPLTGENRPILYNLNAFWYIDGQVFPKPIGKGTTVFGTPLTQAVARMKSWSLGSQGLTDVEGRVRDLDDAGIDIQVIFPTVFLQPLTDDVEFEAALMRSYNTWMGKACARRPDRLKWTAVLPLRNVPRAVEEVRRARDLGAVGAAVYGTVGEAMLSEREFDPVWAEAERLQLPVCVHTGWSHPGIMRSGEGPYCAHALTFTLPVLMGYFAFLGGGVLDRFPGLRLAFLEAGLDWVPYMTERMDHYFHAQKINGRPVPGRPASEYLRDCQIYFTCEGEEHLLPQAIEFVGADRVMVSADWPHLEGRENSITEILERGDLSEAIKRKIVGENAVKFYGL